MGSRRSVLGRRLAVAVVIIAQVSLVVRGYWSDHKEFAYQMFPEASTWQADVVRVTGDGQRIPITDPWPGGYQWPELVNTRGLTVPWIRHHADAGVDNQLAFLDSSLDWVADHTPHDSETHHLEATITYWYNDEPPNVVVLRSKNREEAS